MWALILCGLEKLLRDTNIGRDGMLNGMNIVHACRLSSSLYMQLSKRQILKKKKSNFMLTDYSNFLENILLHFGRLLSKTPVAYMHP